MTEILHTPVRCELETFQVPCQEGMRRFHILLLHGTEARELWCVGETIELRSPGDRHPFPEMAEIDIDQLRRIQTPMIVASGGDRFRDRDPCCVGGLPDVLEIHSTRDFLDQDRCETLGTNPFVDAEEIDLHHPDRLGWEAGRWVR